VFKNLTDFAYKRTAIEALGFYLAYLVLIIVASIVGGSIMGLLGIIDTKTAFNLGTILAIVASLTISFAIIKRKNHMDNFSYILLALLSGILALIGESILGLIPAAILTTRSEKTSQ